MLKRKTVVLMMSAALGASAYAQDSGRDAVSLSVPTISAGTCQALVVVPAKFEPRTEQVVVKEASSTIELIPAEYEWVEEEVEVRPAGVELKVIPATYKTVEEEVQIEPATQEREVIAPQFSEISEPVVVRPNHLAAKNEGQPRTFQSVGEALRLHEIPEESQIITKQVVQESAQVKKKDVPAVFKTVKKQVIEQEARVEEVPVEAVYETVRVKRLVKEAQERTVEIPAEYAEVTVYDKVAEATIRWEQVSCEAENSANNSNSSSNSNNKFDASKVDIAALQRALNAAGYNAGAPDGAMGPSTTRALEKYQRDKKLAVGAITAETLRSLGLK